jgi:hypothetical protein
MEKIIFVLISVLILILPGCKEPIHDVDWWKAHKTEIRSQLKKCVANIGELAMEPNCLNAKRAYGELGMIKEDYQSGKKNPFLW